MNINPYEPPPIPANRPRDPSSTSFSKAFIVIATALFLLFASFESLGLACRWAQAALKLEDWKLPGDWELAWLMIIPATLLTIWLARVTWRSERWDWWASAQIGISLTVWTTLAVLKV